MKTQIVICRRILLSFFLAWGCGIYSCQADALQQSQQTNATATAYTCVQRNPDSRIWQRVVLRTNQLGVVRTNVQSYNEIATGLCYLNNGQYVDSVEQIDPVADGAQASQGRHQVHWAGNANTAGGAVSLTTPDGKQLLSTVYGLAYSDSASGSNVMLAQLQNCSGTIIGANTLVYSNAFNSLNADLRYTYRMSGMSQDVLLRQQPPSPTAYGLNPETTRLQVLTEFFNPPQPIQTTITNGESTDDQVLDFGAMQMGVGHAFLFQNNGQTNTGPSVSKHWANLGGRIFLIEDVPVVKVLLPCLAAGRQSLCLPLQEVIESH